MANNDSSGPGAQQTRLGSRGSPRPMQFTPSVLRSASTASGQSSNTNPQLSPSAANAKAGLTLRPNLDHTWPNRPSSIQQREQASMGIGNVDRRGSNLGVKLGSAIQGVADESRKSTPLDTVEALSKSQPVNVTPNQGPRRGNEKPSSGQPKASANSGGSTSLPIARGTQVFKSPGTSPPGKSGDRRLSAGPQGPNRSPSPPGNQRLSAIPSQSPAPGNSRLLSGVPNSTHATSVGEKSTATSRSSSHVGASQLEKLLSSVEAMRTAMQRDMHDRHATSENITKNMVHALLDGLMQQTETGGDASPTKTQGDHVSDSGASVSFSAAGHPNSEVGTTFSTMSGLASPTTDVPSETQKVLHELKSLISDEKRLHEESLPAACGVLRGEAERILHEIDRVGSLMYKRFQEETLPAACDVLKSEVMKAVAELRSIGGKPGTDGFPPNNNSEAFKAETDRGIAQVKAVIGSERQALLKDGELIREDARRTVTELALQEHASQKEKIGDMIRAEFAKATTQLKELMADTTQALAETLPAERETLHAVSEKAMRELRNFVEYEKRIRQEVLLEEVAAKRESERILEQHLNSLVQERIEHHATLITANFEGRIASIESSAQAGQANFEGRITALESSARSDPHQSATAVSSVPTEVLQSCDVARLSALETQMQATVTSTSRDLARLASLETQVQASVASTSRASSLEARISALEQQIQGVVANVARAAPLQDVSELREDLSQLRNLTDDLSVLKADVAKLRPLSQEVADIRSSSKLHEPLLAHQVDEIRTRISYEVDAIKGLVTIERQERTSALEEESNKRAQMNDAALLTMHEAISDTSRNFATHGNLDALSQKIQVDLAAVRASTEALRANSAEMPSQNSMQDVRAGMQDQQNRLLTLAQALNAIEESATKEMEQTKADALLAYELAGQVQKDLKEESDARLSTAARLETSIDDLSKEVARHGRRTMSLHQLIMHGKGERTAAGETI